MENENQRSSKRERIQKREREINKEVRKYQNQKGKKNRSMEHGPAKQLSLNASNKIKLHFV